MRVRIKKDILAKIIGNTKRNQRTHEGEYNLYESKFETHEGHRRIIGTKSTSNEYQYWGSASRNQKTDCGLVIGTQKTKCIEGHTGVPWKQILKGNTPLETEESPSKQDRCMWKIQFWKGVKSFGARDACLGGSSKIL